MRAFLKDFADLGPDTTSTAALSDSMLSTMVANHKQHIDYSREMRRIVAQVDGGFTYVSINSRLRVE